MLGPQGDLSLPAIMMPLDEQPRQLHRLSGAVTRWLGEQAAELGVEIYPGFAAAEVLYDDKGSVVGVATGDMGVGRDGKPKDSFVRGMELPASTSSSPKACAALAKQLTQSSASMRMPTAE